MKYLITGGSGYIGSRLTELLSEREETDRIVNVDVRPPAATLPKVTFVSGDVRDSESIRDLLEREEIDCLIHLAFILDPIRDEARMYDVDVNGTAAVLAAASAAEIDQMLVASSATAYGAFPDNPVPIAEDWPVRGVPDFEYARDKTETDRLCQLWAAEHPDRVMTIVRPCIVFGPGVDNYIVRAWTKQPFFPELASAQQVQYVHEDDVVEALDLLLAGRHGGPFNLAGDETMTWRECADLIGMPRRRAPLGLFRRFGALMWKLHMAETPPGNLHFIVHPWIVSADKLKETTGWSPRYSSRETFEIAMRAHGKLAPGTSAELPEFAAPVGA